MTRHYSPYGNTQTDRSGERPHRPGDYQGRNASGYGSPAGSYSAGTYGEYSASAAGYAKDAGQAGYAADYDADYDDYADDIEFYEESIDRRWIWVAGVAGAVLLVAVTCTAVILGGGDSGSVSATVASPATTSTAPAQDATSTPARPAPATPSLSPETVTTVTPSPSATATAPEPTPVTPPVDAAPPVEAAPPAPSPNTITYTVTGNRQLIDLVTIVYTDQRGALQPAINVALPWTTTVTLDQGVQL